MNLNKTILFIILLIIFIVSNSYSQQYKFKYLVELDSIMNLVNFKNSENNIDLEKIDSVNEENAGKDYYKILKLRSLIKNMNAVSARKLMRNLPDTTRYLNTRQGRKVSIERFQRVFVIESFDSLNKEEMKYLKENNVNLLNIDYSGYVKVSGWPPNDPYYDEQEQYYNTPYNIDLPRAWHYTRGNSNIKVAIVGHGVSYTHDDLGGGIGEGYRIRGGWDFKSNDSDPLPVFDGNKTEGHATPIAGIIGALNNNSTGVIGIAGGWETIQSGCQIFSFRVTSDNVDDDNRRLIEKTLVIEALPEIAADPSVNDGIGYDCDVINCSFGGMCYTDDYVLIDWHTCNVWNWDNLTSQLFYECFLKAYLLGATIVASRGNEGNDIPLYPASYSNSGAIISVSALNNYGDHYNWSSYGAGVTISAHGILGLTTGVNSMGNTYDGFGGTSNSAPFVSATAALVLSKLHKREKESLPDDIREILKISSDDAGDPGYDDYFGWGRLNAGQAVHIVSKPFNLEHYLLEDNLDVEEVDFPGDDDIICFRYPFNCYIVKKAYRVRGTYTVPDKYEDLDSVWVWSNDYYTWGFPWGNPSWGITGGTLFEKDGSDWTFETYVYKLLTLDGSTTFWHPRHYNNSSIALSILGKDNSCQANVSLTDININEPDCYKAKYKLTVGPNVELQSESSVLLTAGEEIELSPDFSSQLGSNLVAKIEDCYLIEDQQLIRQPDSLISNFNDSQNNIEENEMIIIPNPAISNIKVKCNFPDYEDVSITIFNIYGEVLKNLFYKNFSAIPNINVNDLPPGVYYVVLRAGGEVRSEKVVVAR